MGNISKFEYEIILSEKASLELRLQQMEQEIRDIKNQNLKIIRYAEYIAENLDDVIDWKIQKQWEDFDSKF